MRARRRGVGGGGDGCVNRHWDGVTYVYYDRILTTAMRREVLQYVHKRITTARDWEPLGLAERATTRLRPRSLRLTRRRAAPLSIAMSASVPSCLPRAIAALRGRVARVRALSSSSPVAAARAALFARPASTLSTTSPTTAPRARRRRVVVRARPSDNEWNVSAATAAAGGGDGPGRSADTADARAEQLADDAEEAPRKKKLSDLSKFTSAPAAAASPEEKARVDPQLADDSEDEDQDVIAVSFSSADEDPDALLIVDETAEDAAAAAAEEAERGGEAGKPTPPRVGEEGTAAAKEASERRVAANRDRPIVARVLVEYGARRVESIAADDAT